MIWSGNTLIGGGSRDATFREVCSDVLNTSVMRLHVARDLAVGIMTKLRGCAAVLEVLLEDGGDANVA